MRKFLVLLSVIASVLLAGCAEQNPVVGKWFGDTKIAGNDAVSNLTNAFNADQTMILDIRPNGDFQMFLGVLPIEGKWEFDGSQLSLRPELVGGKPLEESRQRLGRRMRYLMGTNELDKETFELKLDRRKERLAYETGMGGMQATIVFTKAGTTAK